MDTGSDQSNNIGNDQTQRIVSAQNFLTIGTILIGRFQIEAMIGEGSFGQVYKANDLHLNTPVAIKLLHNKYAEDEAVLDQFKQEILILRQLSHQNILRVHEYYQDNSHYFITMDWIDGELLSEKIKQGDLTFEQVKQYSLQVMSALDYAQNHEICHRDLKPENILIDQQDRLYLLDFGMAIFIESSQHQSFGGTPYYCAPEYLQNNDINVSTDYYSLGVIIYEMCCRNLPYKAKDKDALLTEKQGRIKQFPATDRSLVPFKAVVSQLTTPLARQRIAHLADAKEKVVHLSKDNNKKSAKWKLTLALITLTIMVTSITTWLVYLNHESVPENPAEKDYSSVILLPFDGPDVEDDPFYWVNQIAPEVFSQQLSWQSKIRLIPNQRTAEVIQSLGFQQPMNQNQLRVLGELLQADYLVKGKYTALGQNQIKLKIELLQLVGSQLIKQDLMDQIISDLLVYNSLVDTSKKLLDLFALPDSQEVKYTLTKADLNELARIKSLQSNGQTAAVEAAYLELLDKQENYLPGWDQLYHFYIENQQFTEAEGVLTEIIRLTQPGQYHHKLSRARINDLNGQVQNAKSIYQSMLAERPRDESLLFEVAQFNIRNEDLETAKINLEKLVELSPNHVKGLFELAKVSILLGDIQAAIDEYLVRALVSANKLNDVTYKGIIYNAFGVAYQRLGEIDLAIENYNQGLEIRLTHQDIAGAATSMSNLAALYAVKGDYEKAEAMLKNGVKLLDDSGDELESSIMINKLGVLAEEQGRYKEALSHYQNALNLRLNLDDKWLQAESMINVGFIFFLMTQMDHAVIYWQQAEKIYTEIGDPIGQLHVLQNMAQLQLRKGLINQAFQSFEKSLQMAIELDVKEEQFVAKANLAKISFIQGSFNHAIKELLAVLTDLKARQDVRGQVEYGLWLAEWYFELGSMDDVKQLLMDLKPFQSTSMSQVQQLKYHLLTVSTAGQLSSIDIDTLLSSDDLPEYESIQIYLLITRQLLATDTTRAGQLLTSLSRFNVKLYQLLYLRYLELNVLYSGFEKDWNRYNTYLTEALKLAEKFPTRWRNYHLSVMQGIIMNEKKQLERSLTEILQNGWDTVVNEVPDSFKNRFAQQQQAIYQKLL